MTKLLEQADARRLRALGWSLRRIANTLEMSISSVSLWLRDEPRPEPRRPAAKVVFTQSELPGLEPRRRCGRCKLDLPLASFNRHPKKGHQSWCRECFRVYLRDRRQLLIEQTRRAERRRKAEAKAYLLEYLAAHPCVDCGEVDIVVLEFDHLGEKRAEISRLVEQGLSLRALRNEVRRCEVVCVNCHRRRTARRGRWHRAGHPLPATILPGERAKLEYVYDLLRESGCVDCGEDDFCVLDFDHVKGKAGSVVRLARYGYAWSKIRAEIAKCVVRCANCHRRRTAATLGHYRAQA
jgi:hypothetical protein